MSLSIRPFDESDKLRLLDIWLAASSQAHPFFTPSQLAEQQSLVRDVYLEKAETFVAELDGRVVGFIGLLGQWIGGLFVDPGSQGVGVGRCLVDHARQLKGSLQLEAYERNDRAIAFYERLGFGRAGRREIDDNGLPMPLIRLEIG